MQERLLTWFNENKRAFNFRNNRNAYRVWVAEVMLQQTRAQVVEGYFSRFMNKWPTIESLSRAKEDEVIKAFEGLGYYARAKRLLLGAKQIVEHFNGQIPTTRKELLSLAGVGDYTAGAILAFAFKQSEVALDGNVMRVIARLIGYEGVIKGRAVMDKLTFETKKFINNQNGHVLMEALIELGATNCNKKACCDVCPLKNGCIAYKKQLTEVIPLMPQRKAIEKIYRAVGLVEYDNKFAIQKVQEGRVMSSLYEFVYEQYPSKQECYSAHEKFEKRLNCKLDLVAVLKEQSHSFTNYKATLIVKHFKAHSRPESSLKSMNEIRDLPLSSGHKRIFQKLLASSD